MSDEVHLSDILFVRQSSSSFLSHSLVRGGSGTSFPPDLQPSPTRSPFWIWTRNRSTASLSSFAWTRKSSPVTWGLAVPCLWALCLHFRTSSMLQSEMIARCSSTPCEHQIRARRLGLLKTSTSWRHVATWSLESPQISAVYLHCSMLTCSSSGWCCSATIKSKGSSHKTLPVMSITDSRVFVLSWRQTSRFHQGGESQYFQSALWWLFLLENLKGALFIPFEAASLDQLPDRIDVVAWQQSLTVFYSPWQRCWKWSAKKESRMEVIVREAGCWVVMFLWCNFLNVSGTSGRFGTEAEPDCSVTSEVSPW